MTAEGSRVRVQVKYNGVEKVFEGTVEETWLLLTKFYDEFLPAFDIARKLSFSIDLQTLAQNCEGLIAFSPEGSSVLVPKNKITDNEALALWLLASYLGHKLNLFASDALSKEELQVRLGKTGKITSTRLGELVKMEWVAKTSDEKFRLTTFGVAQMQKDVIPRIITKTGI
ncbi:MAG TPA: hypothetical protein VMD05_11375 [Candidatus Nanoarchaeia archaeon]|nr:hypothetical protein [Candidatus Nanoarchaeia archaeon]